MLLMSDLNRDITWQQGYTIYMSIFEALVLGLIQGLTEFIPVSSSGHLLLAHEVFGSSDNTLAFDIALHVGTLLALLIFFRKDIFELAVNFPKQNRHGRLARLLVLATIPAAVLGLLFSGFIEDNLRSPFVVAVSLASVGVLMLVADKYAKSANKKDVTNSQGMKVGFAQSLALIPGVSRSGITMTAGLFSGLSRVQAARFSFLLAMPIIAGSALGILLENSEGLSAGNWQLFTGVIASFVSGLLAIKFLLSVIARLGLKPFALYRIVLAAVVILTLV